MMVTLARIVVAPDTVEPDEGEVTVTIKLPSCAETAGEMHIHASSTRTAAQTTLGRCDRGFANMFF